MTKRTRGARCQVCGGRVVEVSAESHRGVCELCGRELDLSADTVVAAKLLATIMCGKEAK